MMYRKSIEFNTTKGWLVFSELNWIVRIVMFDSVSLGACEDQLHESTSIDLFCFRAIYHEQVFPLHDSSEPRN